MLNTKKIIANEAHNVRENGLNSTLLEEIVAAYKQLRDINETVRETGRDRKTVIKYLSSKGLYTSQYVQRTPPLTKEQKTRILSAFKKYKKVPKVAKLLKIRPSRVYQFLKKNNLINPRHYFVNPIVSINSKNYEEICAKLNQIQSIRSNLLLKDFISTGTILYKSSRGNLILTKIAIRGYCSAFDLSVEEFLTTESLDHLVGLLDSALARGLIKATKKGDVYKSHGKFLTSDLFFYIQDRRVKLVNAVIDSAIHHSQYL